MKHTLTPWIVADLGTTGPTRTIRESKAGGRRVAECQTDEIGYHDAAFIVRACNAHDDLVSALQGAIAYIGDDPRSDRRRLENLRCMTDALIKARG